MSEVIIKLRMPEELYQAYEAQAGKGSVEKAILDRLRRCQTYTAGRPLYFNDAERGELEHITGGWSLPNAETALTRVKQLVKVRVGEVEIELDERILQRMAHRAKAERKEFNVWVTREVTQGLMRSTGLLPS